MRKTTTSYFLILSIIFICFVGFAFEEPVPLFKRKKDAKKEWVDSVYNQLSRKERIGQLIMIRAHSDKTPKYHEEVAAIIRTYKVGGVCFFQGGPLRQAILTNYYQSIANIPLIVAIDGEWGLAMRLDSTIAFPRQMTLGAIKNNQLIYSMGMAVAQECQLIGVNMNFAPAADVNNNPKNPVINTRSFGEDTKKVSEKSVAYMLGMQDFGLMTCAKHFPGHGDTESDSHKTLPQINVSYANLDSIHLFPFKTLISKKIDAVMVAHLFIPCLDTTSNLASTLSPAIVDTLLKQKLNFNGLVFSDALEMKGVSSYFENGTLEVKALQAGIDILLMPNDIQKTVDSIDAALERKELDSLTFELKVKKVLGYKYDKLGTSFQPLNIDSISKKLNPKSNEILIQSLYDNALTLLKNENNLLPITRDDSVKVAFVSVGRSVDNQLFKQASLYRSIDAFEISDKEKPEVIQKLIWDLEKYNIVVVNLINTNQLTDRDYNISSSTIDFLSLLPSYTNLVLHLAGNPYILEKILQRCNPKALLISYDDNNFTFNSASKALFGATNINGVLPVTINSNYKSGCGIVLPKTQLPHSSAFASNSFAKVDEILLSGIKEKAYPGAQLMVVKNGEIIYSKAVGKPTYTSYDSITNDNIYDIASVTKILATTLAVMKLYDQGKLDLDAKASVYLKWLIGTNKEDLVIRSILAHQAQLTPFIPFYSQTIKNKKLDSTLYRSSFSNEYSIEVAENIYLLSTYKDSIISQICKSKLLAEEKYKYSDLSMYLMKEIVETISGQSLDRFLYDNFYQPLGLEATYFNPLRFVSKSLIVPSTDDEIFRMQILQGYVHDPGAAMMGGISGHAGLFTKADEVAILLQMLLQNGEYGGKKYLKASTVEEFTRQQFPKNDNRRGLGFDKPIPNQTKSIHCSAAVSPKSYGHSGFTGTFVWVDPEYQLIYIFLSNRTFPNEKNSKLNDLDIRTRIQDELYEIIKNNK